MTEEFKAEVQQAEEALSDIVQEEVLQEAFEADEAEAGEESDYLGLTAEEVAREDEFMAGIPRFNLAAFLLPPIWGPAHGNWITILYYPLWVFVDNCIYSAYTMRTAGSIAIAVVMVVALAAATWMFAMVAGPMAAHRAAERGISKETYIKRQRIWAVVCVILAALMLGFATYYNLALRGAAA